MNAWQTFWQTPMPYFESKGEKWIYCLLTGFFIFAFLLFFQPFGVNNYDPQERITWLFAISMFVFGLEIALVLAANEFLIRPLFIKKIFDRSVFALWLIWNLLIVGTVIFVTYNYAGGWHDMSWKSYGQFLLNVSTIAIFPIGWSLFSLSFQRIKRAGAKENAEISNLDIFVSENGKERISVESSRLLYIESQDNYSAIYFLKGNEVFKTLIRSSLKRLEEQSQNPKLIRCHRSFLVNLKQVNHYQGNKHGLQLTLNHTDKTFPVSRKFVESVQAILERNTENMVNHP